MAYPEFTLRIYSIMIINRAGLALFIFTILLSSGCKTIGERIADGAGKGITPHMETIGAKAIQGVSSGYRESKLDAELIILVDSLTQILRLQTEAILASVPERVAGEEMRWRIDSLRQVIAGEQLRSDLRELNRELLQEDARRYLKQITLEIMRDVVRPQMIGLRDDLTSESTKADLASIVDTLMVTLATNYRDHIQQLVQEDIDRARDTGIDIIEVLRENLMTVLLTLAGVIAGLVFVFRLWRRKKKQDEELTTMNEEHQKAKTMIEIMTGEIEAMKKQSPASYEQLTDQIKNHAIQKKVEKSLHDILSEQGIVQSKSTSNWE